MSIDRERLQNRSKKEISKNTKKKKMSIKEKESMKISSIDIIKFIKLINMQMTQQI